MNLNQPQKGGENWETPLNANFQEIEDEFNLLVLEGRRMFSAYKPIANDPASMAVRVLPGWVWDRTSLTVKAEQSSGNFAAPNSNPRIDRIVIDDVTGNVEVLTGTEATSPSAPSIPYGKLPIAQVSLGTTTTEITDSDITDERADFPNTQAKALHGVKIDAENRLSSYGQTIDFKTAAFTLSLTEMGKTLDCGSSTTLFITVPDDASDNLPVGYSVTVIRSGDGNVEFGGSGVSIRTKETLSISRKWGGATIYKRAANEWVVVGDIF